MMTLSAALATGLPFKHKDWSYFIVSENLVFETCQFPTEGFFEPVWEVRQPPKPPMRVWTNNYQHSSPLTVCEIQPTNQHFDAIPELAKALAPFIKKELNL